MDDLVKRLRENRPCCGVFKCEGCQEAADRIEALEGYKTEMAKLITSTANANEQLWRRTAKTRREALEEAARACEPHADDDALDRQAKAECAAAIRALMEKE